MRKNNKEEIVITKRQAAELFLVLSSAKNKISGKYKTTATKYWKEFERLLGLEV